VIKTLSALFLLVLKKGSIFFAVYFETEKIEISVVDGVAVSEVDREYLASGNLSISVLPNSISLLVY
jgi:hypothetical protein